WGGVDKRRGRAPRAPHPGADDRAAVLHLNASDPADTIDVDKHVWPSDTKIEHGNKALTACQYCSVAAMRRQQFKGRRHRFRADIFETGGLHVIASSGSFPRARNTTKGVIGSRATRTPSVASASLTALRTPAGDPPVPASPAPFAPITEPLYGVSTCATSMSGIS